MDLKELGLVEPDSHWYYRTKLAVLRRAAKRSAPNARCVVDVGAGSAYFSRELVSTGSGASLLCVDPNYESDTAESDGRVRLVREAAVDDLKVADLLLFIDVLEHVDDDVGLLRQYLDGRSPGTIALITVPAFESIWSGHDDFLGHLRRYTLSGLERVVEEAGLVVVQGRYLYGSIFPIAWLVRRLHRSRVGSSDLAVLPRPVDRFLRIVLGIEHAVRWNRLFGLSAFVVVQVPS